MTMLNPYGPNFPQRSSDPPEPPTHGPCDGCGEIHDNGDLNKIKLAGETLWLCNECLEKETENDDDSLPES